jgi:transcription elongation factor GreA
MSDVLPLTVRGKKLLEDELRRLVHEERPSVIRAIEEARSHGDISENAEYEAAKERQGMVEGRIQEVQSKLAGAEVIDTSKIVNDKIVFGATVTLVDKDTEDEVTYQIVGVDEADAKNGLISIMSPLARALIGKKSGDEVLVKSPKGDKDFEVVTFKYK